MGNVRWLMMGEKRFKLKENLEDVLIEDTITQSQYSIYGIVDLVNEQQATIQSLKEENDYLKKKIKVISDELYCKDRKLEELGVPIECCDKK